MPRLTCRLDGIFKPLVLAFFSRFWIQNKMIDHESFSRAKVRKGCFRAKAQKVIFSVSKRRAMFLHAKQKEVFRRFRRKQYSLTKTKGDLRPINRQRLYYSRQNPFCQVFVKKCENCEDGNKKVRKRENSREKVRRSAKFCVNIQDQSAPVLRRIIS